MNTPAHLLMGAAIAGKRDNPGTVIGAIGGSTLPDATIIFMVFWQSWVHGRTESQIFGQDYYSPFWQEVFAVSNSVPVFLAITALGLLFGRDWLIALGVAALLHVLTDIPLHVDDGHPPFWPFSGWIFESPFSYWDSRYGAYWIAPLEFLLSLALAIWLWFRFRHYLMRAGIVLLIATEALFALGGTWLYGS